MLILLKMFVVVVLVHARHVCPRLDVYRARLAFGMGVFVVRNVPLVIMLIKVIRVVLGVIVVA